MNKVSIYSLDWTRSRYSADSIKRSIPFKVPWSASSRFGCFSSRCFRWWFLHFFRWWRWPWCLDFRFSPIALFSPSVSIWRCSESEVSRRATEYFGAGPISSTRDSLTKSEQLNGVICSKAVKMKKKVFWISAYEIDGFSVSHPLEKRSGQQTGYD